jgi:hypothetical protein
MFDNGYGFLGDIENKKNYYALRKLVDLSGDFKEYAEKMG